MLFAAFIGATLPPAVQPGAGADVTGAGATFPAPVYAKWADAYHKADRRAINYQSVGSGAGIKQIKAKTVDFGASDAPLTDEELARDGLISSRPSSAASCRWSTSRHRRGQIKLTGAVLGDIYLGKITQVERPGADRAEPRRGAAGCRHRPWCAAPTVPAPLHLHQLPVQGERRVEGQGGRGHRP